jgi:hypothetical protein
MDSEPVPQKNLPDGRVETTVQADQEIRRMRIAVLVGTCLPRADRGE